MQPENIMTLQIGLVGTDGIVMASDCLMTQTDGLGVQGVSQSMSSKFRCRDQVCCASGDNFSLTVADDISGYKRQDDDYDIGWSLKQIARCAWERIPMGEGDGVSRTVLVGCTSSGRYSLWQVDLFQSPIVSECHDRIVSGAVKNNARHFINTFAPVGPAPINLPISCLLLPAAYTIFTAGLEQPSEIAGLEIIVMPHGRPYYRLPDSKNKELQSLAGSLHKSFGKRLTKPFDYIA
jgi:hypothetical protein